MILESITKYNKYLHLHVYLMGVLLPRHYLVMTSKFVCLFVVAFCDRMVSGGNLYILDYLSGSFYIK